MFSTPFGGLSMIVHLAIVGVRKLAKKVKQVWQETA
jgi:hypothetical protein